MATPFGKFVRKKRIDVGLSLKEMADGIGVSSAFLSAMETGRRRIPAKYLGMISEELRLSANEEQELKELANLSQPDIKISLGNTTESGRNLVLKLARNLDKLNSSEIEKINRFLEQER